MEGSEEKFWTNSPPSVGVCFLQCTCSVQIFKPGGGGCGVGEGVIAKSLLQNTEKTPECIKETIRKHC